MAARRAAGKLAISHFLTFDFRQEVTVPLVLDP
jgi:hypothetical protein